MSESLNVIALISGGKDSFFSLLHCIQNGHKVVALGNLYPTPTPLKSGVRNGSNHDASDPEEGEHDLNSFMYQTVGHTVIPLYEQALGIPLYRQPIVGTAVQTGIVYCQTGVVSPVEPASVLASGSNTQAVKEQDEDETESLVPLLRRIMAEHPSANALSTGAILSTYQRTRIESVALRLGLTPLAYLWKYPVLHPWSQIWLLEDMESVGLDARIVKVASGGLDESFLWQNVASEKTMLRIEKSMKRFGVDGDGAVLGEGGEFETLAIDGPSSLFKARIEVEEKAMKVIKEGGGSAWLQIPEAKVAMKDLGNVEQRECCTPKLLDPKFLDARAYLQDCNQNDVQLATTGQSKNSELSSELLTRIQLHSGPEKGMVMHWTVSPEDLGPEASISQEAGNAIDQIKYLLNQSSLQASNIISTIILLRSMGDFGAINKVYGALFTKPNPPARVTISCGDLLPPNTRMIIHLKVHNPSPSEPTKKALHVQSRSYWAPANIGPYSQAISVPTLTSNPQDAGIWTVAVAGQIPLVPSTMLLPPPEVDISAEGEIDPITRNFNLQVVLALQHLWRIAIDINIGWWTSAVAYLPRGSLDTIRSQAITAGEAWRSLHNQDGDEDDDENERDLWEEKNLAGMEMMGGSKMQNRLPDWDIVVGKNIPPFFAVEIEELPRESKVEWHAHLGVVKGPVKISTRSKSPGWEFHQCAFGNETQSLLMIDYFESISEISQRVDEELEAIGVDSKQMGSGYLSYLDVSIEGLWDSGLCGVRGRMPCRSLWDSEGKRLAAVLLFDGW